MPFMWKFEERSWMIWPRMRHRVLFRRRVWHTIRSRTRQCRPLVAWNVRVGRIHTYMRSGGSTCFDEALPIHESFLPFFGPMAEEVPWHGPWPVVLNEGLPFLEIDLVRPVSVQGCVCFQRGRPPPNVFAYWRIPAVLPWSCHSLSGHSRPTGHVQLLQTPTCGFHQMPHRPWAELMLLRSSWLVLGHTFLFLEKRVQFFKNPLRS